MAHHDDNRERDSIILDRARKQYIKKEKEKGMKNFVLNRLSQALDIDFSDKKNLDILKEILEIK